jgi:hypothetical protein
MEAASASTMSVVEVTDKRRRNCDDRSNNHA